MPPDSEKLAVAVPPESGSAGTQQAAKPGAAPDPAEVNPVLEGLPMVQAVIGLAASRSRGLGGEITAGLLAGAFHQTAQDYQECKLELKATRRELDDTRKSLAKAETDNAVLRHRLSDASTSRHLKNLLILIGTAVIGFGIDAYRNQLNTSALGLCVVGALLILIAWFTPLGRQSE